MVFLFVPGTGISNLTGSVHLFCFLHARKLEKIYQRSSNPDESATRRFLSRSQKIKDPRERV
jgi:hypothetical protein